MLREFAVFFVLLLIFAISPRGTSERCGAKCPPDCKTRHTIHRRCSSVHHTALQEGHIAILLTIKAALLACSVLPLLCLGEFRVFAR